MNKTWFLVFMYDLQYKMHSQWHRVPIRRICKLKKYQNCEFLSIFLTTEGSNKCRKLLWKWWNCERDKLEKEKVFGKCSVKKVFLTLHKIHRKKLCWSLFFNKVAGPRPQSLLKKRLQHRCFPLNLVNFFLKKNTSTGCFCTKGLFLQIFCK